MLTTERLKHSLSPALREVIESQNKKRKQTMKRYTLRMLIHDARIFNRLRSEYRRTNNNRRKDLFSDWVSRYLIGTRHFVGSKPSKL